VSVAVESVGKMSQQSIRLKQAPLFKWPHNLQQQLHSRHNPTPLAKLQSLHHDDSPHTKSHPIQFNSTQSHWIQSDPIQPNSIQFSDLIQLVQFSLNQFHLIRTNMGGGGGGAVVAIAAAGTALEKGAC
jgi:hypothetical protein